MNATNKSLETPKAEDTQVAEAKQSEETGTVVANEAVAEKAPEQQAETPTSSTEETKEPVVAQEAPVEKKEEVVAVVSGSMVSGVAAALGATAPKKVVAQAMAQKTTAPVSQLTKSEQKIQDMLEKGTSFQKLMIGNLQKYAREMKPGRIFDNPVDSFKLQRTLWDTVKTVVTTEEDFIENWKMVVHFFRQNRDGAMGGLYPFRFMESTTLMNKQEITAFLNLMNLLVLHGGVNDAKDVKKLTNLDKSVHMILGEAARQRIVNFYS